MSSYWIESTKENKTKFESLQEDKEADVCIIGGGITGLSIAYYLSKTNLKVVLLEKSELCQHTTGNSTAKITSQHGLFYDYLIQSLGKEKAKQYLDANEQAIKNIKGIIEQEKIECDYEEQSAYVYTNAEAELPKIQKEVEAVKSLGFPAKFVEEISLNVPILGAIEFPNQAQFNPCKYTQGLVNAMKNQVEIYENTKVIDVKSSDSKEYQVLTENGNSIKAKYVVLSCHYPFINVPGYYFLKMYQSMSYAIGVQTKEKLFDGMYINSEKPTFSFRTTPFKMPSEKENEEGEGLTENKFTQNEDRLLIIVGSDHKTGEEKDLSNSYKNLEDMAKQLYPDSKVLYKWCTEDTISLDKIPYIGEFSSLMPNVYVATGFKKWGITTSNVAANIIVNKILGKQNEYEEVFTSTRLKPIKNYKEMGNQIKQVGKSWIVDKLKIPEETLKDIKKEEGGIVIIDENKVGVYRDEKGNVHVVKPVCTHLGCELTWNNLEKTWDCPCHGSRFTYKGKSIYDPSIKDLEYMELDFK